MLIMKHSPAVFEFTRIKKIYFRDIYFIVLQNVIKLNKNCFKFVDNAHITLIFYLNEIIFNFTNLLLCYIDNKTPVNPRILMATHARNEIFNYKNILYLGIYLLTFLPLIFGEHTK